MPPAADSSAIIQRLRNQQERRQRLQGGAGPASAFQFEASAHGGHTSQKLQALNKLSAQNIDLPHPPRSGGSDNEESLIKLDSLLLQVTMLSLCSWVSSQWPV